MKNFSIGWVFIAAILFSACSGGITQHYTDQQGHWVPAKDSTGKIIGNTLAYDSIYKLEPSFSQKVTIAKHDGTLKWALILWALGAIAIVWAIIYSNGAGKFKGAIVVAGCFGVLMGAAGAGAISWVHTKEVEIPKVTYDSLQNTPNGLKPFWDENLMK